MSAQRDRDEFITIATAEGLPVDVARLLMRHAATLHRLAERECNGDDWQTGQLVSCQEAPAHSFNRQGVYIGPATSGYCPTCSMKGEHGRVSVSSIRIDRLEDRVRAILKAYNITPIFSGDPRGAVVKLRVPSGRTNDWGKEGVCVP